MAGVHDLQEIEGLGSAHFADDDSLRPRAQAVADEIAHRDLPLALDVGGPRLQAYDVRLLELQFGRVLAGDDPFIIVDVPGEAVEQRGLAGTGSAGNDSIGPAAADDSEDLCAFG